MRTQPIVLLLDDEDDFLEIASRKLAMHGFDTVITKTAEEALAQAEKLLPDLVLSDIYMVPGPNGWEFALELRRNPKTRGIKLAFFTTLSDPWLEIQPIDRQKIANELGETPFLSKIDDVEKLAERVRWILG